MSCAVAGALDIAMRKTMTVRQATFNIRIMTHDTRRGIRPARRGSVLFGQESAFDRAPGIVAGVYDDELPSVGAQPLVHEREENRPSAPSVRIVLHVHQSPRAPGLGCVVDGHPSIPVYRDVRQQVAL